MTRHRVVEIGLLLLALLPPCAMAVIAARIWLFGAPLELWSEPAWGLYLLQVLALFGYAFHVLDNKQLASEEHSHLLWQLFLYQQLAMLGYWLKHVWDQPSNLRP
jgi:hypothetical protein